MEDKYSVVNLDIICPVCHKGKLIMIYKVTKIPYFGGILVTSIKCPICGFKVSDIYALSEKGELPEEHSVKTNPERMGDLVVISQGAEIIIPELDYSVEVRGELGGEITTVEGILRDALGLVNFLARSSDKNNKDAIKKLNDMHNKLSDELSNPSGSLTIILKDKNKRSAIIPVELWTKRIGKKDEKLNLTSDSLKKLGEEIVRKFKEII